MGLVDKLLAGFGLLLLAPVFAVIAIAIKLDTEGPVFHRAPRAGLDGEEFRLIKFRSMMTGADSVGPGVTVSGDARITAVGRFIRKTKLDELPQLLNVLRGDMALVGPRPEDPRYVALYDDRQRKILKHKPGITSMASLQFRHEESVLARNGGEEFYVKEIMPKKIDIDMAYFENRTILSDMCLIWKTMAEVLRLHEKSK